VKLALLGYGGHAREVMFQMSKELPCFVSDDFVCGNTLPLSKFDPKQYKLMVAVGDSKTRKYLVDNLPPSTQFFTFIHPTAIVSKFSDTTIGEGSFIGAYSIITTGIKLGKHTLLNRGNHIGHDSIIGDYFSAMPGAIVSGNVTIGNNVYMGTNSTIREEITITDNVTVGLNSGVIKNINQEGTYVGLPAKNLK
jgi:sugar O-acyltransferase (sialic acid O-acetyltransferase NeuD family)